MKLHGVAASDDRFNDQRDPISGFAACPNLFEMKGDGIIGTEIITIMVIARVIQ